MKTENLFALASTLRALRDNPDAALLDECLTQAADEIETLTKERDAAAERALQSEHLKEAGDIAFEAMRAACETATRLAADEKNLADMVIVERDRLRRILGAVKSHPYLPKSLAVVVEKIEASAIVAPAGAPDNFVAKPEPEPSDLVHRAQWHCIRCEADVVDGHCRCESSPSPWVPKVEVGAWNAIAPDKAEGQS